MQLITGYEETSFFLIYHTPPKNIYHSIYLFEINMQKVITLEINKHTPCSTSTRKVVIQFLGHKSTG